MRNLLLILALAYTAIAQTIKCPGPYHAVGTGCYTFPYVEVVSWNKASVICQFSGGYLANIESEVEQMALKEFHDANFPEVHYRFIGATDVASDNIWRWVPTGTTVIYNNWGSGQPVPSIRDCSDWVVASNYWSSIECCTVYSNAMPLCEADPL